MSGSSETDMSVFTSPTFRIIVGPEKRVYHVHKQLLISKSKYFAGLLSGSFKESEDGQVELEEELFEQKAFLMFTTALYRGDYDYKSPKAFEATPLSTSSASQTTTPPTVASTNGGGFRTTQDVSPARPILSTLFGSPSAAPAAQPSGASLFGGAREAPAAQSIGSGPFGSSPFGPASTAPAARPSSTSLFGGAREAPAAQSTGSSPFGSSPFGPASTVPIAQTNSTSLFGDSREAPTAQSSGSSLLASTSAVPISLFGSTTANAITTKAKTGWKLASHVLSSPDYTTSFEEEIKVHSTVYLIAERLLVDDIKALAMKKLASYKFVSMAPSFFLSLTSLVYEHTPDNDDMLLPLSSGLRWIIVTVAGRNLGELKKVPEFMMMVKSGGQFVKDLVLMLQEID